MRAADGATVELTRSSSGHSARLLVDLWGKKQCAFLTADQLRELARDCLALARELEPVYDARPAYPLRGE